MQAQEITKQEAPITVINIDGKELLSIPKAAKLLGLSDQTIRSLVQDKAIPYFLIGKTKTRKGIIRVPRKLLIEYMAKSYHATEN